MTDSNKKRIESFIQRGFGPELICDVYGSNVLISTKLVDHYGHIEASITGRGSTPDEAVEDYWKLLSGAKCLSIYEAGTYQEIYVI